MAATGTGPAGANGSADATKANPVQSGTVKAWSETSGYGLIAPNSGGPDVSVKREVLTDGKCLVVGALVTFELGHDASGKAIANLCVGAVESLPAGTPAESGNWGGEGGGGEGALALFAGGGGGGGAFGGGGAGGAGWGGPPSPGAGQNTGDNLFIAGLPIDANEDTVKQIFGPYGNVLSVKILPDKGKGDRAALVRMGSNAQAQWLVENLNQNIPVGLSTPVSVKFANKSAGGPVAQTTSTGQAQNGTVKVWMEDRGMGFIVPSNGGDDLFVHRSDLADGYSLVKGAAITFEPGWDVQKNKPVAKRVTGAVPEPSSGGGHGFHQPHGGFGGGGGGGGGAAFGGGGAGAGFAGGAPGGGGCGMDGLQDGIVKVWFEEKGYGFLSPTAGGDDAFVHRTVLQDATSLMQGALVRFAADWDYNKNRMMTRTCFVVSTGGQGGKGDLAMQGGTVKVWFDEKGYGFIAADDGSGDVFAHRSHLSDGSMMVQGARVQFTASWSYEKNKYVASKVIGATGPASGGFSGGRNWSPGAGGPPQGQVVGGAAQSGQEVIIAGLPATATVDLVTGIFGPYGTIQDCQMVAPGQARLRVASPQQAQWLVTNLNGNMPVGLESPVSVAFAQAGGYGPACGCGGKGGGWGPY